MQFHPVLFEYESKKNTRVDLSPVDEARFSFSTSLLPLSVLSPIFIPAIKHNYYLQRNFIGRPIRDKNFLFNSVFWPVYFIIVPLDSLESTKKKYEWRGGVIDEADRRGTKDNYEFPGELSGIKYYTLSPMNNLIEVEISPRAGGKHQFIFDLNFK